MIEVLQMPQVLIIYVLILPFPSIQNWKHQNDHFPKSLVQKHFLIQHELTINLTSPPGSRSALYLQKTSKDAMVTDGKDMKTTSRLLYISLGLEVRSGLKSAKTMFEQILPGDGLPKENIPQNQELSDRRLVWDGV